MNISETQTQKVPIIKVVGVGGGGCYAVDEMFKAGIQGVEFIAVNSDVQSLLRSRVSTRIEIGSKATSGLGAGGSPDLGRRAGEETAQHLSQALQGADLVFIIAGLGGGTGTGAAPIVAQIAKNHGALTLGMVTLPFSFEGVKRQKSAQAGLVALQEHTDTLIAIPSARLLHQLDKRASLQDAFRMIDNILSQGVQDISRLVNAPGLVKLDFTDIKNILANGGASLLAIGRASGNERARTAAEQVISNPWFERKLDNARGILFNATGGPNMTLFEVNQAAAMIRESSHPDVNMIFGAAIDPDMGDEIRITLIATNANEYVDPHKTIHKPDAENSYPTPTLPIEAAEPSWSMDVITDEDLDIPSFLRNRHRLQGDSSTDAPPPQEKKGKPKGG